MKLEVNVPENLNDITLGQYQEFLKIETPTEEDILKVFLNINVDGLVKIKAADVDTYAVHITSLFEKEADFQNKFDLRNQEFGFIPNLDEITYGENKDVSAYINDWETMHKAMAVLYRPITSSFGKKYLIEDYEGSHKYSELMKQMPLGIVMGSMVFFYNLTNDLLKAIPNYLAKEEEKEQMTGQISAENGEAIRKYTLLLKEMSADLKKYLPFHYTLV